MKKGLKKGIVQFMSFIQSARECHCGCMVNCFFGIVN